MTSHRECSFWDPSHEQSSTLININIAFSILRVNLSRRFGTTRTNASLARRFGTSLITQPQALWPTRSICELNHRHDCPGAFHLVLGHACSLVFALFRARSLCCGTHRWPRLLLRCHMRWRRLWRWLRGALHRFEKTRRRRTATRRTLG